ncbi:MAG: hypothetical protein V4510_01720 [bacterium]
MKRLYAIASLAIVLLAATPAWAGPPPPSSPDTKCVTTQPAEQPYPAPGADFVQTGGSGGEHYARVFDPQNGRWIIVTTPCSTMGLALRCLAQAGQEQVPQDCASFMQWPASMAFDRNATVTWTTNGLSNGQLLVCELLLYQYGWNVLWACPGTQGHN